MKTTILMGSENHNGWKLEELLAQVKEEVAHKINKIINDTSPQSQLVVRNNQAIIEHLAAAEALQRTSYIVLDGIRANEGPAGTPRIGDVIREDHGKSCKLCGAKFIPSLTAPVQDECHACIMASY